MDLVGAPKQTKTRKKNTEDLDEDENHTQDEVDEYYEKMDKFLYPDVASLIRDLNRSTSDRFHKLNEALGNLIENYNMVSFIPLNLQDEDSINVLLSNIDTAIQFGEDADVQPPKDLDIDDDEEMDETVDFADYVQ